VTAVTLALAITIGMWWTYFDRFAATAEEHLQEHDDPVLAAADGYSYLHLLIIAGIITFAVGVRVLVRDVGDPMASAPRLALCGGVALYLLGHAAFRWRLSGSLEHGKVVVAAALLVLDAVTGGLSAWALAAAVAALVGAMCVLETVAPEEGSFFVGRQAGKHQASEDHPLPLVE
jgi:low temperature requirement protein LtrA